MSLDGINGSGATTDLRGVPAAIRAGGIGATQAVQPRFVLPDPIQVGRRPAYQRTRSSDDQSSGERSAETFESRRSGDGAEARAFTAFVAQSIAQEQEDTESPLQPSTLLAGVSAYAHAARPGQENGQDGVEIIPPTLSSGHALDLVI